MILLLLLVFLLLCIISVSLPTVFIKIVINWGINNIVIITIGIIGIVYYYHHYQYYCDYHYLLFTFCHLVNFIQ